MKSAKVIDYILNWKTGLFVILLLLLCFIIFITYFMDVPYQPRYGGQAWILGDWLINYEDGGFKRRGLSGSFFFLLQDIFHLRLQLLVFIFQLSVYGFFFFYLYKILRNKIIAPYFFTLFLSPLTILFFFENPYVIGRKEILLFALFTWFLYLISSDKLTKIKEYTILCIISICTLFHEIMIFYVSFFIIALKLHNYPLKKWYLYLLSALVPALLIFFFGKEIDMGNSFLILQKRHAEKVYTGGIFTWKKSYGKSVFRRNFYGYLWYPVSFAIVFAHFIFVMFSNRRLEVPFRKKEAKSAVFRISAKKSVFYLIICFLISLPLYYLAVDWGRWLNILFILFLLILCSLLKNGYYAESKIRFNTENIMAVLIIFGMSWWRVLHMGLGFSCITHYYPLVELLHHFKL